MPQHGGSIVKCMCEGFVLSGCETQGAHGLPLPSAGLAWGHPLSTGTLPDPCTALHPQAGSCMRHPLLEAIASLCPCVWSGCGITAEL